MKKSSQLGIIQRKTQTRKLSWKKVVFSFPYSFSILISRYGVFLLFCFLIRIRWPSFVYCTCCSWMWTRILKHEYLVKSLTEHENNITPWMAIFLLSQFSKAVNKKTKKTIPARFKKKKSSNQNIFKWTKKKAFVSSVLIKKRVIKIQRFFFCFLILPSHFHKFFDKWLFSCENDDEK